MGPEGVELVRQTVWGDLIALYLFLGGLGAMSFFFAYLAWKKGAHRTLVLGGSLTGLVAVIVGILALIMDLGRPLNFFLVISSPKINLGSWITIGSVLLTLFVIFSAIFTLPLLMGSREAKPLMEIFGLLGSISALGVALYTGILIGIVEAVPFWHTPALPLLFLISASSTGLAVYDLVMIPSMLKGRQEVREHLHTFARWDSYIILVEILALFTYLLVQSYGQAGNVASVYTLISGDLAPIFHFLVLWLGLILPVVMILLVTKGKVSQEAEVYLTVLAGLLILIGGFFLRYVILHAGYIQVPLS